LHRAVFASDKLGQAKLVTDGRSLSVVEASDILGTSDQQADVDGRRKPHRPVGHEQGAASRVVAYTVAEPADSAYEPIRRIATRENRQPVGGHTLSAAQSAVFSTQIRAGHFARFDFYPVGGRLPTTRKSGCDRCRPVQVSMSDRCHASQHARILVGTAIIAATANGRSLATSNTRQPRNDPSPDAICTKLQHICHRFAVVCGRL